MNLLGHKLSSGLLNITLICSCSVASASDLFISEYIEGSSYNKAIEIYNDTKSTIDLNTYELQFFFNGSTSAGRTIALTGPLAGGDVYILSHSHADAAILTQANQTSAGIWFNGNDAVLLLNAGATIDAIGQVGIDPGTGWISDTSSTKDNTLVRRSNRCTGDNDAYDTFNPATEWTGEAIDSFQFLGSHSNNCGGTTPTQPPAGSTDLFISEYIEGSRYNKAIEIYNNTGVTVDLGRYELQFFFNGNINPARTISLAGTVTQGDVHVITHHRASNALLAHADTTTGGTWFNGDDTILLLNDGLVIDAIGELGTDPGSQWGNDNISTKDTSLVRNENICNGDTNARNSFDPGVEWMGFANNTFDFIGSHSIIDCTNSPPPSDHTKIHDIQGNGLVSPIVNQTVTVEAIVIADFQGIDELSGFYIQEENTDADMDAATSEGIFVNNRTTTVNTGDLVAVTGTVTEHFGRTQLDATAILVLSINHLLPSATNVTLPLNTIDDLEVVEGMRVFLPQILTITENDNLGRYGEVWLSSGGRLMNPTNVAQPGAPAIAQKAANALNRILLDDASTTLNPDPVVYPAPALSAANSLRNGDTTRTITAVVDYTFSNYRLQPTSPPVFTVANPRTTAPESVRGTLKVASFNVHNYFNGDGNGAGFPTSRGADSPQEFIRQHNKIVAALNTIDADIIGLMEIENDSYGNNSSNNSAINELVAGLNSVSSHTYAFVNPGVTQVGTDQITVGLLYKTNTVVTKGTAKILDTSVDSRFNDSKNRPAIAQTFIQNTTGETLTVVVNHLKSKGSSCSSIGDPDIGDGQGNCNQTRTKAAAALVDWLATDPTGSGDADFLIIGDLNAYAKEDPISTIKNNGYSDLIDMNIGTNTAYSYNFSGEAGYLDHALASPSLTPQVTGTTIWHTNSDEPAVLDYNTELKSGNQIDTLYNADAYRASDHDAVIIGISLN